jgi:hypothetical protein
MSLKKSYNNNNKTTLDKRSFMYEVFRFYASYLLPMRLTVCQVVRFMILSGLFALGNTWVYSAGGRSLDVNKIHCLWMIITDPDSTTIEMVSAILYGDQRAHRDGQVNNLSSVWERGSSSTDQFAANADFVHLGAPGDPNDTRDWADMKELTQNNRSIPDDLQLAGGHVREYSARTRRFLCLWL